MKAFTIDQAQSLSGTAAGIRKSTVLVFFILALLIVAFQNCGRASLGPAGPSQAKASSNTSGTTGGASGGGVTVTVGDGVGAGAGPTPTPGATAAPTATPVATPTPSPTPVVCAASTVHFKGEIEITNPYGVCSQKSCSPKISVDRATWVVPQLSAGASYEVAAGPQNWYFLSEYAANRCDNSELYGTFKVTCGATGALSLVKVGIRYFSALPDYSKYVDHGAFSWSTGSSKCMVTSTGTVKCSEQHASDFEVERLEVSVNPI